MIEHTLIIQIEEVIMPGVRLRDGDNIERALKALKKQVEKAGTISELKKRQHYEKPSIKRKKKEAAARKRLIKQIRKMQGR